MKKSSLYFTGFVLLVMVGAILVPSLDENTLSEVLSDPSTWIIGLVAIFLLLSIIAVTDALESIKYHVLKKEGRLDEIEEAEEAYPDNVLARLWRKMQDARPIEEEAEIELDHNYDGIHELDNNLPPWWLWGFYISIVFAVVYLLRFHVFQSSPLQLGEYQEQMAEAELQKAEYLKNAANLVDENNVVMLADGALLEEGAEIYKLNCEVCHAQDGGGGVGPNLTDAYWIHGGDIKDVFSTIKYGVPAKGMISWKDQLNPSQMQKVASFIMTFQGTTPANPKEAQGELYEAVAPAADSTANPVDSGAAVEVQDSTQETEM